MNGQIFCQLGGEQLKSLRGCLFDAENNLNQWLLYIVLSLIASVYESQG